MTEDLSVLIPVVDRLMDPASITFDPADAIRLRDAIPIQSRIGGSFHTVSGPRKVGGAGPVTISCYTVLHTCSLIYNHSILDITPIAGGPAQIHRLSFDADGPEALCILDKKPVSFRFLTIDVNLGIPDWKVLKTPKVPEPSRTPQSEAAS